MNAYILFICIITLFCKVVEPQLNYQQAPLYNCCEQPVQIGGCCPTLMPPTQQYGVPQPISNVKRCCSPFQHSTGEDCQPCNTSPTEAWPANTQWPNINLPNCQPCFVTIPQQTWSVLPSLNPSLIQNPMCQPCYPPIQYTQPPQPNYSQPPLPNISPSLPNAILPYNVQCQPCYPFQGQPSPQPAPVSASLPPTNQVQMGYPCTPCHYFATPPLPQPPLSVPPQLPNMPFPQPPLPPLPTLPPLPQPTTISPPTTPSPNFPIPAPPLERQLPPFSPPPEPPRPPRPPQRPQVPQQSVPPQQYQPYPQCNPQCFGFVLCCYGVMPSPYQGTNYQY